MRGRKRAAVGIALLLGASLASSGAFATSEVAPAGAHGELGCEECHEGWAPEDGWVDCDRCHPAEANIHPVGVVPRAPLPETFPLGEDGRIRCWTCHRLHGGAPERAFLRYTEEQLFVDRQSFCSQCHGLDLARVTPHSAELGETRCAYCHASRGETPGGRGTARLEVRRLCNFCHGALFKGHPRNVDPGRELPAGLPLGADGEWTCVTCHDPHGTVFTTHYIRLELAESLERFQSESPHVRDYFACKACHSSAFPDEIAAAPDRRLRYRGDIGVLCVSCHVTDRGHHPTGIRLPEKMRSRASAAEATIPLDGEGRIDCYTCHDNSCRTGDQAMVLRHYDRRSLRTDLCWLCHDRREFARTNPHVDNPDFCTYCHESRPRPGLSTGLLTVAEMVCLHCHEVTPHPVLSDHLKAPSGPIVPDEDVRLDAAGEVTCTTCHYPHDTDESARAAVGETRRLRLRYAKDVLCGKCHWK